MAVCWEATKAGMMAVPREETTEASAVVAGPEEAMAER